ncbi:translocation/assembly module TamB [Flammeovirga pectinis]|uniref:Translocation/assembly module TamB n=1 Tax=Flammeovirga pectinis TaxID=2494373 RepID=A0A3Q9FKX4_9BACT|nr:translocation/assembly module TamB domain-containing protein [Flammeovirga pectinis]AZQ62065.1 translocation/assembly module TamB [Flammeovirga pectinis]
MKGTFKRIFFAILLLFIILLSTIYGILRVPYVQNIAVNKITSYVSELTKSEVKVGYIALDFPKTLVLENVDLQEPNGDNFLHLSKLEVDIDLETISLERIVINDIGLHSLHTSIRVNRAGDFNFNYLINAFVSDSTTTEAVEEDTTSTAIPPIIINNIQLTDVRFHYLDSVMNIKTDVKVNSLTTQIPLIDINTSTYTINSIDLYGTQIDHLQFDEATLVEEETNTDSEGETSFILSLLTANINDFLINYTDNTTKDKATIKVQQLSINNHSFDLLEQDIKFENLFLDNTLISYSTKSDTLNTQPEEQVTNPKLEYLKSLDIGWKVAITKSSINNLKLVYDDNLYKPTMQGLDPNHIYFKKIDLDVNNLNVSDDEIKLDVPSLKAFEKNGLSLTNFSTEISIKPQELHVKDLLIEINNSFLYNDLYLKYPNLYTIGDHLDKLYFRNHLLRSHISFNDALIFDPSLKNDSSISPFITHNIDGKMKVEGTTSDMSISDGEIRSSLGLNTDFNLQLNNVLSEDSLKYQVAVDSLNFYTNTLASLFLDDSLKESFLIPPRILGDFNLAGDLKNLRAKSNISLLQTGAFNFRFQLKNEDEYSFETNTYNLNVGQILKDTTIGKVSTHLTSNGKGFDIDSLLLSTIKFQLKKAEYNNYDYGGLDVALEIDRKAIVWKANTDQKELSIDLTGNINLNEELPTASIIGDIGNVDLRALNFMEDSISFGMKVNSQTHGFDISNLNTTLDLNEIKIQQGLKEQEISYLKTHIEIDSTHILGKVELESINANIYSNISLDSLPIVLERYFSQYLSSRAMIGSLPPSKGVITAEINIEDGELLTKGNIDDLDTLEFNQCTFNFDAASNKLDFDLDIPRLTYSDIDIDSLYATVDANGTVLTYNFGLGLLELIGYEDYAIHNWSISGNAEHNNLRVQIDGKSEDNLNEWLYIGGDLTLDSTTYKYVFDDRVRINNNDWKIDKENYILSYGGLPYVNKVQLSKDDQSFALNSTQFDEKDTVYSFTIHDYSLDSTTYNIDTDTSVLNGLVNADIKIGNIYKGGVLDGTIDIEQFGLFNSIIADIKSNARNTDNIDIYENQTSINGIIGNINVQSEYNIADSLSPLEMTIAIDSLLIKPFEYFAKGYASNFSGGLNGNVVYKGLGNDPMMVKGKVDLLSPSFNIDLFNVYLTGTDGNIVFDEKGIHFNQVGFKDSENRLAAIGGDIFTKDYEELDFKLKFSADDITLINSTQKDNPEYYGKLIVGNLTKITGPFDHLIINSTTRISRGTDLTYVYMDGGLGEIDTGDDIINFVNKEDSLVVKSKADNYEIKATINIDDKSKFKVVIDPRAGDALTLVGGGTLNLRMDAGGDLVMSGQYQITKGDYSMTFYQLMNKKLLLQKGSSVLWTGDPYNPQANMTAIYEAMTSPYPLVVNQINQSEANKYKSKRRFKVYMNMRGDVINPDLSFKLEYPEGSQGGDKIESSVEYLNQDESQLNKQVFSLLILGTFLNDSGGGGSSTTDMVTGSVSSIISQQLNNVTDNLTNGFVDVDFDLDSYSQQQESGTSNRTDLGVTVKKTLFNDRLSVSVGGKVAVSGNQAVDNNSNNTFNTDFLLEYSLMADGTLKNRLFRQIDAQYFTPDVFKTGVSIMFTKDYNKGKELFIRNLDKKKDIRKRMGMIKRSNTGGGMMQATGDSTAKGGTGMMAPADETEIEKDTVNTVLPDSTKTNLPSDVPIETEEDSENDQSNMDIKPLITPANNKQSSSLLVHHEE